jgi:hypothetical protein
MEANRLWQFSCEDCTVLGVTFDSAVDCGLYLLAVSSNQLPGQVRPVLQVLSCVHLCIPYCPLGHHT